MAWIEDEPWPIEQGIDAVKIFELVDDEGDPWPFDNWDVNATISDPEWGTIYAVTVSVDYQNSIINLILPESIVNTLQPGRSYTYDCLLVAPGDTVADDYFLATGPVTVALRTSRRDEA
jgi:hypothetical protein